MVCCPRCGSADTGFVLGKPLSYKMNADRNVDVYFLQVCHDCGGHGRECHFVSKATCEMVTDENDLEAMGLEEYNRIEQGLYDSEVEE